MICSVTNATQSKHPLVASRVQVYLLFRNICRVEAGGLELLVVLKRGLTVQDVDTKALLPLLIS